MKGSCVVSYELWSEQGWDGMSEDGMSLGAMFTHTIKG